MPDVPNKILRDIQLRYTQASLGDLWQTESIPVSEALYHIFAKLPSQRYTLENVLGVGGSGIVLRVADSLFPTTPTALKFPRPIQGRIDLVSDLVLKEMQYLSELKHPGIVRILYYAVLTGAPGYNQLPFYLMEMVDGEPSHHYLRDPDVPEASVVRLIASTAEILTYLHGHRKPGFAHLDIKPDNIVVTSAGQPILIDLGTCKRMASEDTVTMIACTRGYAHPELMRLLARDPSDTNRARGTVARSMISERWDLWSFGQTVLTWLGVDPSDGTVTHSASLERLSSYTRRYLLLVAARLLTDALPSWLAERLGLSPAFIQSIAIRTSSELHDVLSRLDAASGPLWEVPELVPATTNTIQAGPDLHVTKSRRLTRLFEHRLFRRLNTITQLGFISQVYPGAQHKRRDHSIGTYANAIRIVRALWNDPVSPLFRQIVSRHDLVDTLLGALLHDLGQFPLAHDLEEIDSSIFDHAELTQSMLHGTWEKKKRGSRRVGFDSLDDVFAEWDSSASRVTALLSATPTSSSAHPRLKLLRSIISGPIDADKIDYLLRDSRHLNLPYPQGIDTERLLRCLTTVVLEKIEGGVRDVPAIGVHAKGKVAAEFLSIARYAMFCQAYWHHAVRAHKAMLFRAVAASLDGLREEEIREYRSSFVEFVSNLPESLYPRTASQQRLFPPDEKEERALDVPIDETGIGTDLEATDAAVLLWFRARLRARRRPEVVLIDRLLTRRLFRRLWVLSPDMDSRAERIMSLWDGLSRTQRQRAAEHLEEEMKGALVSSAQDTTNLTAASAQQLIQDLTLAHEPWLLVDIPGERRGSEIPLHYVREAQGRSLRKDLRVAGSPQPSEAWEKYAGGLRLAAGKVRVYCRPDLLETVESSITIERGMESVIASLERASSGRRGD